MNTDNNYCPLSPIVAFESVSSYLYFWFKIKNTIEKMIELQFPFSSSIFHHAYPPGKYFDMFLSQH